MNRSKKRTIKRTLLLLLLTALVILLAVLPMLATEDEEDGPSASILSGTVTTGQLSGVIRGGGTLTGEEAVEISIPSGVLLTEFLVSNGDTVSEGDAIALADRVTVMSAIAQVQETLEYLNEEIEDARGDEVSSTVTAQAGGRVKLIYAEPGDDVQDVMLEHGALAVLSLDGMMAVDISRSSDLSAGDSVIVTLSDGTEITGWVESNLGGTLVITVTDEGYAVGETVMVKTEDGDRLGSGQLYIHNAWNATAISGTVSKVHVSEETAVTEGRTLFTLTDTEYSAQFVSLCAQRREYEALMLELFRLYQDLTVTATCGGAVSGVDADSASLLSATGQGWSLSLLVNAPNGDDSQEYHNYLATVAALGENGWAVSVSPENLPVTDYKLLEEMTLDTTLCTELALYSGTAPIYELVEGQWQQVDAASVAAGDTLLFAVDVNGSCVWIIRVEKAEIPSDVPGADTEGTPDAPAQDDDTPEEETGDASDTQLPQGDTMGGFTGGFSGGTVQEEAFEMYSLERTGIASVTAQNTMTISITVDELDIGKLSLGQTASFTVDALKGETFTAQVSEISSTGESSGGNSKFTVTLTLDRAEDMLSGMNAAVEIPLEGTSSGLLIPVEALSEEGTATVVYTAYDESTGQLLSPVTVETGASDGKSVLILSGLQEGDTFWYAYYDTLDIETAPADTGSSFSGMFGR